MIQQQVGGYNMKYDQLITKMIRGLGHNTLTMDHDDLMQYGRMQVCVAMQNYKPDNPTKASEFTFIYKHLYLRFGNLFHKSLGNRSIVNRSEIFNKIKTDTKRGEGDTMKYQGIEVNIEDMLNSVDLSENLNDEVILLKQAISNLLVSDVEFECDWNAWTIAQEKMREINQRINQLSDKWKRHNIVSRYKETKGREFDVLMKRVAKKVEKELKWLEEE